MRNDESAVCRVELYGTLNGQPFGVEREVKVRRCGAGCCTQAMCLWGLGPMVQGSGLDMLASKLHVGPVQQQHSVWLEWAKMLASHAALRGSYQHGKLLAKGDAVRPPLPQAGRVLLVASKRSTLGHRCARQRRLTVFSHLPIAEGQDKQAAVPAGGPGPHTAGRAQHGGGLCRIHCDALVWSPPACGHVLRCPGLPWVASRCVIASKAEHRRRPLQSHMCSVEQFDCVQG